MQSSRPLSLGIVLWALSLAGLIAVIARMLILGYTEYDIAFSELLRSVRLPATDTPMLVMSLLGDWPTVTATVCALCLVLIYQRRWTLVVGVLVAMALTGLFVVEAKAYVQAPRPMALYSGVHAMSFPSGHTTFSALLGGILSWFAARGLRGWSRLLVIATLVLMIGLMALSRVYLGAHWPLDVIAGLLFSLFLTLSFAFVFRQQDIPRPLTLMVLLSCLLTYCVIGVWYVSVIWPSSAAMYGITAPALAP